MEKQDHHARALSPAQAQREALLERALETLERAPPPASPPSPPSPPTPNHGAPPHPELVPSPTLEALEAIRRPQPGTACESCRNSVWFASKVELKCYCRVMYLVTWSSNQPQQISACDGMFLGGEP